MEAQHRAANGRPKVNGGHVTGACWAPRAVHRDRWLHCACCFNRGPMWTPSRPLERQNHTGFCVAVLNCMQEIKNRPFWTAPSGLKRVACHVLAALSALQQRPTRLSLILLKWIYIFDIFWSICAKLQSVRLRWELGQQILYICFDCLVRIFWRAAAHVGYRGVITWHDFTWRGQGYIFLLPPHPPTWSCTYARLFRPTWSRGVGGVQLVTFTWCMGAWTPPYPSIGSRTRATICQYNVQFSNYNFKLFECQIKVSNGSMLQIIYSNWIFKL